MTWAELHRASEILAIEAEHLMRKGNATEAEARYGEAAELEQRALDSLGLEKARTRGITAVSAVSLWFRAANYERAEQLAYSMLSDGSIPAFAKIDLRNLVQAIWTESTKSAASASFLPGQVFVSVKGGEVVTGGAPLDLIVEKVQTIQSMFYRTVEFIRGMPLRSRGAPPKDIQEFCRPWLFQAAPGSYQFSVAIQEVKQLDLFGEDPRPDLVAHQFLEILKATASDDPKALESVVPKPEYRAAFLKLSRNLAPTGKSFESIELRAAASKTAIAFTPEARKQINQSIKSGRPVDPTNVKSIEEEIIGTLRAVDLEKDSLDVVVNGESVHIVGLGDALDDVIGPMVNKTVKVQILRDTKRGVRLRDIEPND